MKSRLVHTTRQGRNLDDSEHQPMVSSNQAPSANDAMANVLLRMTFRARLNCLCRKLKPNQTTVVAIMDTQTRLRDKRSSPTHQAANRLKKITAQLTRT